MPKRPKTDLVEPTAMADRLRALRNTTGLSQEKFSVHCGLGYKQWGNFETGSRIGLDAAIAVVRKMHVTLDWIYLGDERGMTNGVLSEVMKYMPSESATA